MPGLRRRSGFTRHGGRPPRLTMHPHRVGSAQPLCHRRQGASLVHTNAWMGREN